MISDCENFSNDSFVALYYIWIPTYFIHGHTVEEQALCPGGGVGDEDSGGVVLQLLGEVLHVVRLGLERHQVRVQLRPLRLAQLLLRVLRTHTFSYPGQRCYSLFHFFLVHFEIFILLVFDREHLLKVLQISNVLLDKKNIPQICCKWTRLDKDRQV